MEPVEPGTNLVPALGRSRQLTGCAVVIGCLIGIAIIALPGYSSKRTRSPVSRVKNDMRSLATGIETFYVDAESYPPMTSLRNFARHPKQLDRAGGGELMTFEPGHGPQLPGLTTPISYVTSLYADPFAPEKGLPFAYYTDGPSWIVISPGPDGDYDIRRPPEVFTSEEDQPSSRILVFSYDPTNGTSSSGDLWRVRQ